ncbi:MAG: hypothetical protein COU08_03710 [Candidatus Harrisonbacteria bacterium CG10_big_fil_rev_8_21_14_0_10_42_17]|uniref:Uncharacterized protein n=1 Tax=Candidatus Harrisonbacteria bacterium CG10_big_fil_rev_8_21_14_0_10_42_17 TaxID=1974584 RepID=A0A2M6WH89_9BACT|nr:MAG: hypothetical protein COU08_03710 [Candidatus Harrisonbacteria bacterium CG10_big_fil_rev_8_21_14_0_10_42_17]
MNLVKRYIAYVKDNPNHHWFKRRLFGLGWVPVTREGWLVVGVYLLLLFALALTIDERSTDREVVFTFLLPLVLLTATLIRICYKKGEKPRWSWGFPKKKKEEE